MNFKFFFRMNSFILVCFLFTFFFNVIITSLKIITIIINLVKKSILGKTKIFKLRFSFLLFDLRVCIFRFYCLSLPPLPSYSPSLSPSRQLTVEFPNIQLEHSQRVLVIETNACQGAIVVQLDSLQSQIAQPV